MVMDANWGKYDTLCRFKGSHGSTDFSDFFKTTTFVRTGTGAIISTSTVDPFGENSGVMNISSGYVFSNSYRSLTGNFSFGAWLRFSATTTMYFLCIGGSYTTAFWLNRVSGVINLYAGSTAVLTGAYAGSVEWVHINVSRLDGVLKMHINGVSNGTASSSLSTDSNGIYLTCRAGYYSYTFLGQISHFYVSDGDCLYWDDFTPLTAAPVAPSVSGTVLDATSSPTSRTVNLYRRSSGELIASTTSNATTGIFTLDSPYMDAHCAVCLDDDFNENALIFDNIIPV